MYDVLRLREQHGGSYAIRLPDGQLIPWRALTVSEYLEYERLFQSGVYPRVRVEDEIFQKCVLDKTLLDNMGKLRAGVVTAVVNAIMSHSGPQSVGELNELLEYSRALAGQVVHDLTSVICTAFPAYTPDSLQELDFVTFMLRVAQAEKKLLQAGILSKPLEFDQPGVQPQERATPPPAPRPENLAGMWNEQQRPQPVPPPVDQTSTGKTVITKSEMVEHHAAYTGHEKEDRIVLEKQMVDTTAGHYDDYIEQMKDGKQVQIKSVEQRVAEAEARAKENEAKYKAYLDKQQSEQEKLSELVDKRRAQRAAKRKKR